MYTFIIQDFQGNYFTSKECFDTKQEAEEASFILAEYDFVVSVDVVECKDIVGFNSPSILN
jgi:hypothetical protein